MERKPFGHLSEHHSVSFDKEVRRGQLWEFSLNGNVRRARVIRVTVPINGVRYVYLKPLTNGRAMRVTLRQLQRGRLSRLVEDASPDSFVWKAPPTDEIVGRRRPSTTVHEPRMSISDRRHAVARAHLLHDRGITVAQIATALCVMPGVVEVWLAEGPAEGTGVRGGTMNRVSDRDCIAKLEERMRDVERELEAVEQRIRDENIDDDAWSHIGGDPRPALAAKLAEIERELRRHRSNQQ